MNKINVFTAFSGYDSQCLALDRLKKDFPDSFDYELVGWSEIDKYAINAQTYPSVVLGEGLWRVQTLVHHYFGNVEKPSR